MLEIEKKNWILTFGILSIIVLVGVAFVVILIDPFFHYHKPLTDKFSYVFENQRYQNDGITKNFNYTGMITGTSMTENFMKSEADNIFGGDFIKVPYSGGSYKEINDNIIRGINRNKQFKTVIRGLDYGKIFDKADAMRFDLGEYAYYLYDDNLLNDVHYIYNYDVIKSCYKILYKTIIKKRKGIENNFDSYSNWMHAFTFGKDAVLKDREPYVLSTNSIIKEIPQNVYKDIKENIYYNVLDVAVKNPNMTFYYFFTPYSVAWWGDIAEKGEVLKFINAEEYIIKELVTQPNIHLFSYNNFYGITTDLNNYKDTTHYGEWINSDILRYMKNDIGRLTIDNYQTYIQDERNFYSTFDYNELFNQVDEPDRPIKFPYK